jgi:hypothetical protein
LFWASRFAATRLASGYPLHHLRARPLVGRFGGSATIPLAQTLKKNIIQLVKYQFIMKKLMSYSFAVLLTALFFTACSKDQTAVRKLDGKWQVVRETTTYNNGTAQTTPTADLGDIRYEFTKCKQKKEGLCDGKVVAALGGFSFEIPFGYMVEDKGETLIIDEDNDTATTNDQNRATIVELSKDKCIFTYTETDGNGNTTRYEYEMDAIED